MANHLQSLLKSLLIPSENIKLEGKKDVDLFFKAFRKKRRIMTMKLNKQQITKSQVILYHENIINSLEKVKKKRIEDIISVCQDIFFNGSFLTDDINLEKNDGSSNKRKLSEDHSNSNSKKPKIIIEETPNNESVENNEVEICNLKGSADIVIDLRSPSTKFPEDVSLNQTFSCIPENEEIYVKNKENEERNCLEKVNEPMLNKAKQIPVLSKCPTTIKTFKVSSSINTPKHSGCSKPTSLKPVKASESQAGQTKTPLFKNKFHNELSSKTKSLSKTQTPLVPKKTVAEIRKIQDQQAVERRQKIEEDMRRKNAQIKLVNLKATKNLMTTKFQASVSKQNVSKPPGQNALKLINSIKANSPEKTITAASINKMSTTASGDKTYRITESSVLDKSLFKTPFAKKRLTMLSNSCQKIIENHETLDLSSLVYMDSDDEDEESERMNRGPFPKWVKKTSGTLSNLMKYQSKHWNSRNIFRNPALVSIDIKTIFGGSGRYENYLEKWI